MPIKAQETHQDKHSEQNDQNNEDFLAQQEDKFKWLYNETGCNEMLEVDRLFLYKKMLGCFDPILGQIWKNPNVGLKMQCINVTQRHGFVHI